MLIHGKKLAALPSNGSPKGLWYKFLIWLMWGYVSVAFHATSTAFHIVGAVLV
jgi:hypothetical protein